MKFVWTFLGSGFFTGYVPHMPGTVASLVAVLLALLVRPHALLFYGLLVIFLLPGTLAADRMEKRLGRKDPSCVVVDEMAGIFVAAAFVPAADFGWLAAAVCFVLFRVFDIAKPWPIGKLQDLPGGFGIMADDVLAGLVAGGLGRMVMFLVARFLF